MSTNLYWRAVPNLPQPGVLPKALKYVLAPRYFDHDGTLRSDPHIFGVADLPYLAGLKDGGVAGAESLIQAIHCHGDVEVWIDE